MKTVLLILDSPVQMAPYVQIYIDMLKRHSITYDLIYWRGQRDKNEVYPKNYISFDRYYDIKYPYWRKMVLKFFYCSFARNHLRNYRYSYVVVFSISNAIILHRYLKKHYRGSFIIDIRDYSRILCFKLVNGVFNKLIRYSAFIVVSSKGFLSWLPKIPEIKYLVSHNVTRRYLSSYALNDRLIAISKPYKVLTIGQLRDFEANALLIDRLGNNDDFRIVFSGYGIAEKELQEYSEHNQIHNVAFLGRYDKEEEASILERCDLINVFMPKEINSNTLMSNRFYLSVLHRKPMIVRKHSFQADIVASYGLGVVLDVKDDFKQVINSYIDKMNIGEYNKQCRLFIEEVYRDIDSFESNLIELFNNLR